MDGVLNVRKAAGPTSHDVVDEIRRIFSIKRVGHAGTLDPMATGVLVVCLGKATRVVEYLVGVPKEYRARMVLGKSTDTQDSTGVVTAESDASGITRDMLEEASASFTGEIEQIPPMVSALKHQGKPLYKLARQGITIERSARKISIYSLNVLKFTPGQSAEAEILVKCSSGTYIRTLCADIGDKLGCGAHMSMLERTSVGRFTIEKSVTIDQLLKMKSEGHLETALVSIGDALDDMPLITIDPGDMANVLHGLPVNNTSLTEIGETVRMLSTEGHLVALGTVAAKDCETIVKPRKVLAEVSD